MNRHQRRAELRKTGWVPLEPATAVPISDSEIEARIPDLQRVAPDKSAAEIREFYRDIRRMEVWRNHLYQVHVVRRIDTGARGLPLVTHLSIRRLDRQPVTDWRDKQRIKNQLVGAECEGVELYPAESRLVDTANQYHVFVVEDPTFRFPFGFHDGRHVDGKSGAGAVQRPLDPVVAEAIEK